MPQDQGGIDEAKDPWLYAAVEELMGVVALSVIQGQALLQVCLGSAQLTKMEQGAAQRPICCHEQGRVVLPLGLAQQLLPEFARRAKLAPRIMKPPQPKEGREELVGLPDLLAQLPGTGIGSPHFRRGKT